MRRCALALILAGVAASGCQGQRSVQQVGHARPDVILPALSDTCGSKDLEIYAGRPFTELADAAYLGDLRILRPGQKVDGYISPSRVNVQLDSTGVVRRIFCG